MRDVLLAQVHATVEGTVHTLTRAEGVDGWVIAGTLASAVVAIFTGWLAFSTRTLAEHTKALAEQTAKLAEETNTLARETLDGIGVTREAIAAEDRRHRDSFQPHLAILTRYSQAGYPAVYLRNVGPGYAQEIRATYTTGVTAAKKSPPQALEPHDEFMWIVQNTGAIDAADMIVEYRDAFGSAFQSRIDGQYALWAGYTFRRL